MGSRKGYGSPSVAIANKFNGLMSRFVEDGKLIVSKIHLADLVEGKWVSSKCSLNRDIQGAKYLTLFIDNYIEDWLKSFGINTEVYSTDTATAETGIMDVDGVDVEGAFVKRTSNFGKVRVFHVVGDEYLLYACHDNRRKYFSEEDFNTPADAVVC